MAIGSAEAKLDRHLFDIGISPQMMLRGKDFLGKALEIASAVFSVGQIIVTKSWGFIAEHPNMTMGILIGIACGALVNVIPLIGSLLAPFATVIGCVTGALAGKKIDQREKGSGHSSTMGMDDVIAMAKEFYKLLAQIFQALSLYFKKA